MTGVQTCALPISLGLISRKTGATRALLRAVNDESVHVQYAAIVALGDNGRKSALSRLFTKLRGDDMILKVAAVKALGNIGSRKAVKPLIELYESGDDYIRSEVVMALGRIGGAREIYDVLVDAAESEGVHDAAIHALGLLDTKRARKLIEKFDE